MKRQVGGAPPNAHPCSFMPPTPWGFSRLWPGPDGRHARSETEKAGAPTGRPPPMFRGAPYFFAGAGAAAGVTIATGPNVPARTCACRDRSIDSPRMRAISCGAWKPMEFSAAT